ncbi:MAG TPA: hypothetical protein VFS13_07345 [Steroidobacteraceae bacterium]|nr:hypothetical protein [Steroidobacteraceae bacterium]
MPIKPRLSPVLGAALISMAVASAVGAAEPAKNATQLPNQVIPTDADVSAAPAAAAAARTTLARTVSQPSAEQLETQLRHMTSESAEGLVAVRKAGKSRQVNLDDRFMSVAVARQTTDGGTEVSCLTGQDAVKAVHAAERGEKVVSSTKKAPAQMEEK